MLACADCPPIGISHCRLLRMGKSTALGVSAFQWQLHRAAARVRRPPRMELVRIEGRLAMGAMLEHSAELSHLMRHCTVRLCRVEMRAERADVLVRQYMNIDVSGLIKPKHRRLAVPPDSAEGGVDR